MLYGFEVQEKLMLSLCSALLPRCPSIQDRLSYLVSMNDILKSHKANIPQGVQNFGSPFRVPGLVTIGPNFKLVGQISGEAVMQL